MTRILVGFTVVAVALTLGLVLWLTRDGDDPRRIEELAADAGCADFTQDDGSTELFVRESGSCQIDGQDVFLYTYSDEDAQQAWLDAAATIGGGVTVSGPLWAANVLDADLAERLADQLDGDVQ